jgi:hypothetical protein
MDDEIKIGVVCILGFIAILGWTLFYMSKNVIDTMVTPLPNGCILYEEKIWCEEVEDNEKTITESSR